MPALDLEDSDFNLALFPVPNPAHFDSVTCDDQGYVREVEVKRNNAHSHWIWGAVTARGESFHRLKLLWEARHRADQYLGDMLNAFIAAGNTVRGRYCGEVYMDVGTLEGYRTAQDYLRTHSSKLRAA